MMLWHTPWPTPSLDAMSFKTALENTLNLENSYQPGLQALRAEDRPHIQADDTRRLRGSADIDAALLKAEPNANRWDFAIAYQHTNPNAAEFIYFVELHTASDSQVSVVIRKAQWLVNWLQNDGRLLAAFDHDIVWVSSGSTSFTPSATKLKQMALLGMRHCGTILRIRNKR
jgi:hypothetical protein